MPFRSFGVFKLQSSTVPQPLVGSWITAGIGGPSNAPLTLTLGTAMNAGNDGWSKDFEALSRQYWNAWSEMARHSGSGYQQQTPGWQQARKTSFTLLWTG